MGTDFSIKPAGAPIAAPVLRPLPAAAEDAVATELPASQSIAASDAAVPARADIRENPNTSQQISIDRAAAEIVYKVVDSRTSLVIKQFPDEALLRSRAYTRALDDARLAKRPFSITDLNA